MSSNKHLVGVILRALAIMSISALVMAIVLSLMNLQDALLVFMIAAPFITAGISLIFARSGFDSLFSRKTQSVPTVSDDAEQNSLYG